MGRPPTHCPNGHELLRGRTDGGHEVGQRTLVGHQPCSCPGRSHHLDGQLWRHGVRASPDTPVSCWPAPLLCISAPWSATIGGCLSRCTETNPTPSSSLETTTASTSSRVAS